MNHRIDRTEAALMTIGISVLLFFTTGFHREERTLAWLMWVLLLVALTTLAVAGLAFVFNRVIDRAAGRSR